MDLLPAILLAIPIAALLIAVRVLIVLQNRKHTGRTHKSERTVTIARSSPRQHP